jgi:large subunit ribosomal protein L10
MNRDQKAAVIDEIAADISAAHAIFAIDYRGITVAQAEALRAKLRESDASFRVVKNSLSERAADKAGAEALKELLAGPTALTFARGDAAAAAKAVSEFARTTQLLAFKGGVMDGAALSAAEVGQIARLPSRDVLYGQLVGLVASPISRLARTLNALIGGLAVGLGAVLEARGGSPIAEPEAADSPAEEAAAVVEPDGSDSPAESAEAVVEPDASDSPAESAEAAVEPDAADSPAESAEAVVEPDASDSPAESAEAVVEPDASDPPAAGDELETETETDAAAPEAPGAVDEDKENE